MGQPKVLNGTKDAYHGVHIDPDDLPSDPSAFATRLTESLLVWKRQQRKGIWLKLPTSKAGFLLQPALQHGFTIHHAEASYIQLTRWLPSTTNKLPASASHQAGVGCFVLNERHEVLMVQEGSGYFKGKGVWKIVTEIVEAGEDITAAAKREVLEETGVRARFEAVLAFRQAHGCTFGKSDFFFIVALRAEPGQHKLTLQEDELEAATWMPLEDYTAMPYQLERPLWRQIMECCVAYAKGTYKSMQGITLCGDPDDYPRKDSHLLIFGEDVAPSNSRNQVVSFAERLQRSNDIVGSAPLHVAAEHHPKDAWRVWAQFHPRSYTEDDEEFEKRLANLKMNAERIRSYYAEHKDDPKRAHLALKNAADKNLEKRPFRKSQLPHHEGMVRS